MVVLIILIAVAIVLALGFVIVRKKKRVDNNMLYPYTHLDFSKPKWDFSEPGEDLFKDSDCFYTVYASPKYMKKDSGSFGCVYASPEDMEKDSDRFGRLKRIFGIRGKGF